MHNALLPITEIIDWERRRVYIHTMGLGQPLLFAGLWGRAREKLVFFFSFFYLLCQTGVRVAKKEKGESQSWAIIWWSDKCGGEGGRLRLIFGLVGMWPWHQSTGEKAHFLSFLLLSGKASVVGTKCEPSIFVFLLPSLRNERQELADLTLYIYARTEFSHLPFVHCALRKNWNEALFLFSFFSRLQSPATWA